jgi:hypothetical protein
MLALLGVQLCRLCTDATRISRNHPSARARTNAPNGHPPRWRQLAATGAEQRVQRGLARPKTVSSSGEEQMDSFRRPGGFASSASPTRRHLGVDNCTDANCGCSGFDGSATGVGGWARSRQPSTGRTASVEVEPRHAQPWCGDFELRPYVQLIAVDIEARRVAVFLFSQLAVLALELLLPALWRMDPALLGAGLRGLLRSISLALVLHAMTTTTRSPTTAYSYGCGAFHC